METDSIDRAKYTERGYFNARGRVQGDTPIVTQITEFAHAVGGDQGVRLFEVFRRHSGDTWETYGFRNPGGERTGNLFIHVSHQYPGPVESATGAYMQFNPSEGYPTAPHEYAQRAHVKLEVLRTFDRESGARVDYKTDLSLVAQDNRVHTPSRITPRIWGKTDYGMWLHELKQQLLTALPEESLMALLKGHQLTLIGQSIRSWRKERSLLKYQLSKLTDAPIGQLENCLNTSSYETLMRIAYVLHIPLSYLLEGIEVMPIGEFIRIWRKKRNLRQRDIRIYANDEISRSFMTQVERNRRRPSIKNLHLIANQLDIPFEYFENRTLPEDVESDDLSQTETP